jgi:tetratricopeptide (TPR) repeat protein
MAGQWEDAYRIAREELDRHPRDSWRQSLVAYYAGNANRPNAAIEAYESIEWDPLTPGMMRTILLQEAADALHRLGRHDEELALVQQYIEAGPVSNFGFPMEWYELRALIGLGRLDDIAQRVSETLSNPQNWTGDAYFMVMVSDELRAHGFPDAARSMAERSLAWWELHPEVPRRLDYTNALMRLGRFDEALEVVEAMLPDFPDTQPVLLATGKILAHLGRRDRALGIDAKLAELGAAGIHSISGEGTHGVVEYRSAQIAALLGDHERAINLLQEAVSAGFFDYLDIHSNPAFEPLWDHPEFQEIMRPKG